jgi:hypothetical protein
MSIFAVMIYGGGLAHTYDLMRNEGKGWGKSLAIAATWPLALGAWLAQKADEPLG